MKYQGCFYCCCLPLCQNCPQLVCQKALKFTARKKYNGEEKCGSHCKWGKLGNADLSRRGNFLQETASVLDNPWICNWGNVLSSLGLPNIADSQRNALATPSVSPPQCKSQTLPVTQILPSPDVAVVCEPAPACELLQREERNRGRKMGQFTAAKGTQGTVVLNEVERKREHWIISSNQGRDLKTSWVLQLL